MARSPLFNKYYPQGDDQAVNVDKVEEGKGQAADNDGEFNIGEEDKKDEAQPEVVATSEDEKMISDASNKELQLYKDVKQRYRGLTKRGFPKYQSIEQYLIRKNIIKRFGDFIINREASEKEIRTKDHQIYSILHGFKDTENWEEVSCFIHYHS